MTAPAWLENAVIEGLQSLLVLRLRGAPPNDTITALADVWIVVFDHHNPNWHEHMDLPRLREAFLRVAGSVNDWPAPATVLSAMKARPEQPSIAFKGAPLPPIIRAQIAALTKQLTANTKGQK